MTNILDDYSRLNGIKTIQGLRMTNGNPVSDYINAKRFEEKQVLILLSKINALVKEYKINRSNIDIQYNLNICNGLESSALQDIIRRLTRLKKKESVILNIKETYG